MSLKFSHRTLIFLAGALWLAIGIFLLTLGIKFLMTTQHTSNLFSKFTKSPEQGVMMLILLSLLLGFIKGRTVMAKAARKQVKRILALEAPTGLKNLYSPAYYILIGVMISFGMILRFLPITLDIRGAIDCTIGCALINGAMQYFRYKAMPA